MRDTVWPCSSVLCCGDAAWYPSVRGVCVLLLLLLLSVHVAVGVLLAWSVVALADETEAHHGARHQVGTASRSLSCVRCRAASLPSSRRAGAPRRQTACNTLRNGWRSLLQLLLGRTCCRVSQSPSVAEFACAPGLVPGGDALLWVAVRGASLGASLELTSFLTFVAVVFHVVARAR
jgi:hypothetical protein